jgi:hypothetical protein
VNNYPNEKQRPVKKQPWYSGISLGWGFLIVSLLIVILYYGIEAVVR